MHLTGSTSVFDQLWLQAAQNLHRYWNYLRLVEETGGKNFVLAHPSADVDAPAVRLLHGAFEHQGQKCSAASRAYVPASPWPKLRDWLLGSISEVHMGDVRDLTGFISTVIDRKAYDRISRCIEGSRNDPHSRILIGGEPDSSIGYFVWPTVIEVEDAGQALMREEILGPVLAVRVYEDARWTDVLSLIDSTSSSGLTVTWVFDLFW